MKTKEPLHPTYFPNVTTSKGGFWRLQFGVYRKQKFELREEHYIENLQLCHKVGSAEII